MLQKPFIVINVMKLKCHLRKFQLMDVDSVSMIFVINVLLRSKMLLLVSTKKSCRLSMIRRRRIWKKRERLFRGNWNLDPTNTVSDSVVTDNPVSPTMK